MLPPDRVARQRPARHHILMLTIRAFAAADWPAVWELFRQVAAAGDVFAYDETTPEEVARKLWVEPPAVAFVAPS